MKTLGLSLKTLPYYVPSSFGDELNREPVRKQLIRPESGFAFIAPIKQSLMKDARLMPGTRCMIALLAGWGGNGRAIDTTLGAIGKQLGRSARQVQRYLRDAAEEGYIYFRQITDRMGYIIGLRISLNRSAIYAQKKKPGRNAQRRGDNPQPQKIRATTQESDINPTLNINPATTDPFELKLRAICERNAIPLQSG